MRRVKRTTLDSVSENWIINFPKTINLNGCWIPNRKISDDGYVRISIKGKFYKLHRLSLQVFHNISYYKTNVVTRHSKVCSRACFNPEHIKPGSGKDNVLDSVDHGTHCNSSKSVCSICGGSYSIRITKTGANKGHKSRYCKKCSHRGRKVRI